MACRRAVQGSLFVFALVWCVGGASAQDAALTDAQRIAALRDQASQDAAHAKPTPDATPSAREADPSKTQAAQGETQTETQAPLPAIERLSLGQGAGDLFNGGVESAGSPGKFGDGWLLSTLAALGIVIALVFALRWVLRRGGIVTSAAPQGSVVEVLSRTTVAPRSHVVLMRIGPRILIVNDSPNGMRTLDTVQDPEEVAELLGAIDAAQPTSITKSFGGVMSKLSNGWSSADAELDEVEPGESLDDGVTIDQTRGALSSVRGRLAALSGGGIKA